MTALASATQHATGSHPAEDQPDEARAVGARKITPYLLLIPGLAWLVLFFIVPMVQLAVVSLESKSRATRATTTSTWPSGTTATP